MDTAETPPAQPLAGDCPPGDGSLPAVPGLPDDGPLTVLEALAAAAWLIPAGRAVAYGGLAALLGAGGARQAGRAMAESAEGTPWWRVVRADGSLPTQLAVVAKGHWETEGTPLRGHDDPRVDLSAARWQPDAAAQRSLERLAQRSRQA
ncbi:MGMT family protein [Micrococcus lylae]|uniref:MGMT family protein n=1 Tax=Micrococcus TaxID=1269 RepID=UPI000A909A8E|nr:MULTISPECIES: MGMT family protein [Micrococcus]MCT2007511.1 MGMT family protein [Micrococcus lylae]MCT2071252.1 MGMT family protein [Micrococcus lylae]